MVVLDYWHIPRNSKSITAALVHWSNLPLEDATWEDIHQLTKQFPTLDLVDKVPVKGGRNDRARGTGKPKLKYSEHVFMEGQLPTESKHKCTVDKGSMLTSSARRAVNWDEGKHGKDS